MYRLLPRVIILAHGVFFFALNSNAQILDLPRESPKAQVSQRIGVTDIAIQYSRPLVKGRKIWGGVVPLGDIWRAGANENTTIEFSDPVTVEGKPLPKGVYGLHMIPNENEWTVIFSKNSTSWGEQDQAFDIFRTNIKKNPNHWAVHSEVARLACAKSRFDEAVKEMKLAAAGAPAQYKPGFEKLTQRLEAKEDINK